MVLAKNSMEGKAENYVRRIENVEDEILSIRGAAKKECKKLRDDQDGIYVEADDNGVPRKALKGFVKRRQLLRKMGAISNGFDIDEAAAFQSLVETLGELGMAAAKRAGHAPTTFEVSGLGSVTTMATPEHPNATEYLDSIEADDKRDFRPSNLRNTNPEDVEKLGRGPVGA